jgi:sigma-E factor negative regulatory protein RseB
MLKRSLSTMAVVLVATCCTALCASPRVAVGASDSPLAPSETRDWLMRIHDAASHSNFQGTFVVSAGGAVSSSRIAHFCVGASQFESIESLDGQMRSVFRHDDVVHTLWPKGKVALVEQRSMFAAFPALLEKGGDRIAAFYDVRSQGTQRMAGRQADVLLLRPKDGLRYGYRLWADRETGLLLRVEVLGQSGEVLESSAFSDLSIGVKPQTDSVLLPMNKLDGYRVLNPRFTPARLDAEGWTLRQGVPGFEQVSCVRRPLTAMEDGDDAAATRVLQTIYSDGLAHVSVFIEPYDPARHLRSLQAVSGATQTLMRRLGDWWVTVVGEVPAATLRRFANALEHGKY